MYWRIGTRRRHKWRSAPFHVIHTIDGLVARQRQGDMQSAAIYVAGLREAVILLESQDCGLHFQAIDAVHRQGFVFSVSVPV